MSLKYTHVKCNKLLCFFSFFKENITCVLLQTTCNTCNDRNMFHTKIRDEAHVGCWIANNNSNNNVTVYFVLYLLCYYYSLYFKQLTLSNLTSSRSH